MRARMILSSACFGVAAASGPWKASSVSAMRAPVTSRKCVISGAVESGWINAGSAPMRIAA